MLDLESVRMRTVVQCHAAATAALSDMPVSELFDLTNEVLASLRETHRQAIIPFHAGEGVDGLCALDAELAMRDRAVSERLRDVLSVWTYTEAMIVELELVRMRTALPRVRAAMMYRAALDMANRGHGPV